MNLEKEIFDISLKDIIPNRFQPREIFDEEALNELSQSIKEHGVIQPIIVRKVGDKYEIIAGERRFRASQMAGKETIPALVKDIDDKEVAKIALLENLQRSNLTPIEEAKTYQTILKIDNITQDELAVNLGKSQATIANKLRLLTLDEEVQTALLNSQISERHARSLIGLAKEKQRELLHRIINEKLTVRQLDEEVMKLNGRMPNNEVAVPIQKQGELQMNTQVKEEVQPTISNGLNNTVQPIQTPLSNIVNNTSQSDQSTIQNIHNNSESHYEEHLDEIKPNTSLNINSETPPVMENIFDKLRVKSEETEEPREPKIDLSSIASQQALSNITQTHQNDNIQANEQESYSNIYDLRFAINNFRQAIQNTEKFGFKVSTSEEDQGDKYKIVIEIDKNQGNS